jgi:Fic family protein
MPVYIHQLPQWPQFMWDQDAVTPLLAGVRYKQGRLLGRMENLGFPLQIQASLTILTLNVLKSSEIEGEILNADAVRSSVAKRLGIELAGLPPADRYTDAIVQMMLDATKQSEQPLSAERLIGWQSALFPTDMSGFYKIAVGAWRNNPPDDPMQVISGAMSREKVHFVAPESARLETEMKRFINWFNEDRKMDPVLKAAVAHLWFVTIHPFDDGNGRLARALTDMQLARADGTRQRFYSMSTQIRKERDDYYDILENTKKDRLISPTGSPGF